MKKLLTKNLCLMLVTALAMSAISYAGTHQANNCVRIYCKDDVKTKLRNVEGHGDVHSAFYDTSREQYVVQRTNFAIALARCAHWDRDIDLDNLGHKLDERHLYGTDASKMESFAPWIRIYAADEGDVIKNNPKCGELQKR